MVVKMVKKAIFTAEHWTPDWYLMVISFWLISGISTILAIMCDSYLFALYTFMFTVWTTALYLLFSRIRKLYRLHAYRETTVEEDIFDRLDEINTEIKKDQKNIYTEIESILREDGLSTKK